MEMERSHFEKGLWSECIEDLYAIQSKTYVQRRELLPDNDTAQSKMSGQCTLFPCNGASVAAQLIIDRYLEVES